MTCSAPLTKTAEGYTVYRSTFGVDVRICAAADLALGDTFLAGIERALFAMGDLERARIAHRAGHPWAEAQTGRDGILGLHYERQVAPNRREPAAFGVNPATTIDPELAGAIDGLLAQVELTANVIDAGIEKRAERRERERKAWLAKRETKTIALQSGMRQTWDEIRALPDAPGADDGWRLVTVDRNEAGQRVALFERMRA